jgi:hypothetical protein
MRQSDFERTAADLGRLIALLLLLSAVGFATLLMTTTWYTLLFRNAWS